MSRPRVVGVGTNDNSLKVPIGLLFTHAWVPNEVWEPDVGLGGTVTVEGEKNPAGGRDFSARFGVTFVGGTHIWLWGSARRWGLNLDLVYTLQVTRGVSPEVSRQKIPVEPTTTDRQQVLRAVTEVIAEGR